MSARILVVDDVPANVKILEAKLTAEYFDVMTAMSGPEALALAERHAPDIVLVDLVMPGMDGVEVCRRIKGNFRLQHVPIVMVTAHDEPEERLRGLESGADDFLVKPVDDTALFCRLRNLVRLKSAIDELRARAATGERMGLVDEVGPDLPLDRPARIMLVDDTRLLEADMERGLKGHELMVMHDPRRALDEAGERAVELVIVNLDGETFDGLRLCSQLRSAERTRHIPILLVVGETETDRLLRGLDMGVNDYLVRPVEPNELLARANTQIRRWRYTERLRRSVQRSMEMAIVDELTGFYNRRYMETHLGTLVDGAAHRSRPMAVLAIDVDFFKSVNDTYGHAVGDAVLKEIAGRIRTNIRHLDLPCRVGGEEFIVVLPETDAQRAYRIAERVRTAISSSPFPASPEGPGVDISLSIGVAAFDGPDDTAERLLRRADQALYRAKRSGRNRVVGAMAAGPRPLGAGPAGEFQ